MSKSKRAVKLAACGALVGAACLGLVSTAAADAILWKKQLGTAQWDGAVGIAADSASNVYVTGYTSGPLFAQPAGGGDVWVVKYDQSGQPVWHSQFGSIGTQTSTGVTIDSEDNVVLAGETDWSLFGAHRGGVDAWLAKYDGNGNVLWSRQFGTEFTDEILGVVADRDDNILVAGSVGGVRGGDAWVAKFDGAGNLVWSRQAGTVAFDSAFGVAADADGNVYAAGSTQGSFAGKLGGERDAFLIKYDSSGKERWRRQIGTGEFDDGQAVATDSLGNVFLIGNTTGALAGPNRGSADAWVVKFDGSGHELWRRQIGTVGAEFWLCASVDKAGNLDIAGTTEGSLARANMGGLDVWTMKLSSGGEVLWRWQRGSSGFDRPFSVATDAAGQTYLVGESEGAFAGPFHGATDAWIVKLAPPN